MQNTAFARGDDAGQEAYDMLKNGTMMPTHERGRTTPRFFVHKSVRDDGTLVEQECVEIFVPGDNKTAPVKKVTDHIKQIYAPEYEAWKNNTEIPEGGTSLIALLGQEDPRIEDLRYNKIRSVEQLAEASDTIIQGLGMGYSLMRDQARAHLERHSSNDHLAEENKALKAQMAALSAQVASLASAPGDGGGSANLNAPSTLEVKRGKGCFVVNDGTADIFSAPTKGECELWVEGQ